MLNSVLLLAPHLAAAAGGPGRSGRASETSGRRPPVVILAGVAVVSLPFRRTP